MVDNIDSQYTPGDFYTSRVFGSPGRSQSISPEKSINTSFSRGLDQSVGNRASVADKSPFRTFGKHLELHERYEEAMEALISRGQSPEALVRIVQSKLAERVHTYADQLIRARRLFETFDANKDGCLQEDELRKCLEALNLQLDDIQSLVFFAYMDRNYDGLIDWDEFADHVMVVNPRSGNSCLPKVITAKGGVSNAPKSNATDFDEVEAERPKDLSFTRCAPFAPTLSSAKKMSPSRSTYGSTASMSFA